MSARAGNAHVAHNAVIAYIAAFIQQRQAEQRRGLAHGAGLYRQPFEHRRHHRSLRLAETFADFKAGEFFQFMVHLRAERFPGHRSVADKAEVVAGKVFLDKIAEDRGRRAERSRPQPLYSLKHPARGELFRIVHADGRAADPLAVYFAPGEFRPARIGLRQMHRPVLHAVPVFGGNNVPQRQAVVVEHHLGHAGSSGRKIDQHGIARCRIDPPESFICLRDDLPHVNVIGRDAFAHNGDMFQPGAVGPGRRDIPQ